MTTETIKIEDTVRLRADHTKTGVLVSRSPSGNFGAVEWETGGRTVVLMDTVEAVPAEAGAAVADLLGTVL